MASHCLDSSHDYTKTNCSLYLSENYRGYTTTTTTAMRFLNSRSLGASEKPDQTTDKYRTHKVFPLAPS